MSPIRTTNQTTSEYRATQLLICEKLSLANIKRAVQALPRLFQTARVHSVTIRQDGVTQSLQRLQRLQNLNQCNVFQIMCLSAKTLESMQVTSPDDHILNQFAINQKMHFE